jgi:lipid II:glycine glycyltransferase (peptidoglycan interpeptide bridge formation enzyme)
LKTHKNGAEFLQSENWAEILCRDGEEVLQIGVRLKTQGNNEDKTQDSNKYKNGKDIKDKTQISDRDKTNSTDILLVATLIRKKLFTGCSYLYAPRGPIFSHNLKIDKKLILDFVLKELKKKYSDLVFVRLEPGDKKLVFNAKKTLDIQPAQTLILNLSLGEKELLKNMHQKTRYNIRLASKKGVVVREVSRNDLGEFWRLLSLTGKRDNFRLHGLGHYKNLMAGHEKFIKLYLASYQGHIIAGGLFSFYGQRVTYLHGASDNKFRNVMAPYLLQWSVIKEAQSEGYKYYDFYGIDEKKWPGVTRFKLGFAGEIVKYPGTYDFVFKPFLYTIYNFLRKLRRLI